MLVPVSIPAPALTGEFASTLLFGALTLVNYGSETSSKPTPYSKFSIGGGDAAASGKVSGKVGMLLIYSPALVGISLLLANSAEKGVPHLLVPIMLVLHFGKRVLETLFLHVYSGDVSFATSSFIGVYYLIVSLLINWWMGLTSEAIRIPEAAMLGGVLFTVGELGNLYHHYLLASLRKASQTKPKVGDRLSKYVVPQGGLFSLVATPHYLFELTAWLGIAIASQHIGTVLVFTAMTSYLAGRAKSTTAWNRANIKDYPLSRKHILPGIF